MDKENEFSIVRPRLEQARHELLPLFPTKGELLARGLKEMILPHEEKDWYEIIIKEGRQLGEIAGLWPLEQDIMSVWFFKRLQKQAHDYKREMGFETGIFRPDSDEDFVLGFIKGIGSETGHEIAGEENAAFRGWLFSLKELGDGLAKMIVTRGCSDEDITTFMREKLRASIGKRVPFQEFIAPYLDATLQLTKSERSS